jgi:hypothetical protein
VVQRVEADLEQAVAAALAALGPRYVATTVLRQVARVAHAEGGIDDVDRVLRGWATELRALRSEAAGWGGVD